MLITLCQTHKKQQQEANFMCREHFLMPNPLNSIAGNLYNIAGSAKCYANQGHYMLQKCFFTLLIQYFIAKTHNLIAGSLYSISGNSHSIAGSIKCYVNQGHIIAGSHNTALKKRFFMSGNQNLIAGSIFLCQEANFICREHFYHAF